MPDRKKGSSVSKRKEVLRDLQRPLNWQNYSQKFQLLLRLEELHLKTVIEQYNQENVTLLRDENTDRFFILQSAGGSPLMLSKSQVYVTPVNQSPKSFRGLVSRVDAKQVYLQLRPEFQCSFIEDMRVSVRFTFDRMPLNTQHRAAEFVYKHRLQEVLFPTAQPFQKKLHLDRLFESRSNLEQSIAIQQIVTATAKPAPYLVFGPPGTGKTATLVEAIKKIVQTRPLCNILVCAPSNSAADHLCERILEGGTVEPVVYRFYSLGFPLNNISKNTMLCCNLNNEETALVMPPIKVLMKYKILVTTLLNGGRLVTGGVPPGHYSYIFVDEAGQATETECIVPLAGLVKPETCQVVLAGDPKQLGPVITSSLAKQHGLGLSLLQRLMTDVDLYKPHEKHGFDNCYITKLLKNYRSHPAILKIPNELFYGGELQMCAQKEKCSSFCKWELLPKNGFPLIFHGVAGANERDAHDPSLYNTAEVDVVIGYLKAVVKYLHKQGVTNIPPKEIGIVAPYRKQVEKIQSALQADKDLRNLKNVLVGSVEQFQGKEFNVILMSTVRSFPNQALGFVNDERRFNVALTRARALLIMVGDPRALRVNRIWNRFISYCCKERAYRGLPVW